MSPHFNSPSLAQRPAGLIERALPFENRIWRYALLGWVALGLCSALWTIGYSKPKIASLQANAQSLFALERQLNAASEASQWLDMTALAAEREAAQKRVFRNQAAVDRHIGALLLRIQDAGWHASLVAADNRPASETSLKTWVYELELQMTSPTGSTELLDLVSELDAGEAVVDIDRIQISTTNEESTQARLALSACSME